MLVALSVIALAVIAYARPDVSHLPSGSYLPTYNGELGPDSDHNMSEDQKHVYFYASPNGEEYTRLRINVVPKSHKNTKIIFVKAPHHAGVIPEVVAPPSLAEDKTLVYVLVKKPVDGQSIDIPAGLGVKQLKPEVFFLKYNNKHEAESQIQSGIQGNNVGVSVPDLQNELDFVNALGNGQGHEGMHGPSVFLTTLRTMQVVLLIATALVAIVGARPDASHLPSGSYLPSEPHNLYGSGDLSSLGGIGSDNGFHQSEDEKHVYFYAHPNDEQYTRFRISVVPKSHKNTKIIFVKAPHHAGVIPEVVAPPSLAEDKTLVYVLVKKPVDGQSIIIPAGLGVKQAKPEVFFIKYNNKHEAEAHVHAGIQGQRVGVNVPDLPNDYAFINALGNGHEDGGIATADHGSAAHSGDSSIKHGPPGASGPY
ncbi:hypothetical protein RN001_005233 [Aquatica leii]|uniref:DUF243 domain-containing protein n=1 Tax=Aquatica leii TaxID=1421715 RepID=A0AAN7Q076_9COLE|nr:hypothetical protein RN001_005233 [Aquatica leii]